MTSARMPVGVSACLLGDPVRFDAGHKRDRFLTEALAPYVEWVSVCPEVAIGLGVPRESIRLVRGEEGLRLLGTRTGRDVAPEMIRFAALEVERLRSLHLRGFVLKKDSPSCGMERVRVYDANGVPAREGSGLFARALLAAFPELPVEEEGRLHDSRLRENFVNRLFAYDRWLVLLAGGPAPADLVRFHTRHKMMLLAHDPRGAAELGRLVARAGSDPLPGLLEAYGRGFMGALRQVASPGRHVNALHHLAGFLKKDLPARDRRELLGLIEDYRRGWVPLITPLVLLRHHLRRLEHAWVDAQVYLEPYPAELALRSAV